VHQNDRKQGMREHPVQDYAYCERLVDPGFWAEPLNAITNLAFIVAAIVCWIRLADHAMPVARLLVLWLFGIGVGSGLFHTFATPWAGFLDVLFIALFVVTYFHAANRYFLAMSVWLSLGMTMMLFVYIALASMWLSRIIPVLGFSSVYASVALLIAFYGILIWRGQKTVARGLMIGAAVLTVSIAFRTIDKPFCAIIPLGTHFIWHLLNAAMLAWMIELLKDHLLTQDGLTGKPARTGTG